MGSERDPDVEREANRFALVLLMPKKLVEQWVKAYRASPGYGPLDPANDGAMEAFARDFEVPVGIGTMRLCEVLGWTTTHV